MIALSGDCLFHILLIKRPAFYSFLYRENVLFFGFAIQQFYPAITGIISEIYAMHHFHARAYIPGSAGGC